MAQPQVGRSDLRVTRSRSRTTRFELVHCPTCGDHLQVAAKVLAVLNLNLNRGWRRAARAPPHRRAHLVMSTMGLWCRQAGFRQVVRKAQRQMAQVLGLGVSHCPPLSGSGADMANLHRARMADPDTPAQAGA